MAGKLATFKLVCETDALQDAIAQVRYLRSRCFESEGAAFRDLERKIEAWIDNPRPGVKVHTIGGGRMFGAPAGILTEILRDGRKLGLIN